MLSIKNLQVKRDEKIILNDISLELKQGELLSLLGPSGCGKSTLLHSIIGFLKINSGEISLNGEDLVSKAVEERNIGIVFQDNSLFPNLSIFENVGYGIDHLDKSEREQRIYELLDLVNLREHSHKMPHQLSGGQKQRIAIIRALATKPSILLLDECFSSLDEKMRVQIRSEVKQLLRKLNITAILVTHDKNEAINFSTQIAVLGQGLIQQLGNSTKLLKSPNNEFVARFFGNGNVIRAGDILEAGYYPNISIKEEGAYIAKVISKEFYHGRFSYRVGLTDHDLTFNEVLSETDFSEGQEVRVDLGDCCAFQ